MISLTARPDPLRATTIRAFLAAALCFGNVAASAAGKIDEGELLLAAGVVHVATRAELEGTSYHKELLAHGVAETSIVDGTIVVARLLCCRDNAKASSVVYLHNPLVIQVAPGDTIELRTGNPKAPNIAEVFSSVSRVLQRADQADGQCWWEPRDDRMWMRFIYCEWMPTEGWIKRGSKLNPGWYKPAAIAPGN